MRDVVNAIQYIAATGCQWSLLPREFPPFTTVQRYFYDWRNGGVLRGINHLSVMAARELEGRIQPFSGRYRQSMRKND
jgi:transposase